MDFYFNDTYTFILMYCISFVGLSMFMDKNRLILMLGYLGSQKYALLYHRKEPVFFIFFGLLNTLILFAIGVSFYLFSIGKIISFFTFLLIIISLFFLFIIKIIASYLLGLLFEIEDYAKKYYYEYTTSLIFCSMLYLPIIIFVSYFNDGIIIKTSSLFLAYLFSFIYLFSQIIMLNRLNLFSISFIFYNILYLCALEALPYLILFSVLHLI